MLTTFVVNTVSNANALNDGFVSLREAVTAANTNAPFGDALAGMENGDRIWFDPDIAGSTITLTQELVITDDLMIQGGMNDITIASNGSRHFSILANERVSFGRLTFSGGIASKGGSILSMGTLSPGSVTTLITNSVFENNEALLEGGGAIYHSTGNLFVIDTDFINNRQVVNLEPVVRFIRHPAGRMSTAATCF